MIIKQKIMEIEDKFRTELIGSGGTKEENINQAEKELGINFPYSYRYYLLKYNSSSIGTEVIYVISENKNENVVEQTKYWREKGLPESFVVVHYDGGENLLCIDTSKKSEESCPLFWVQMGFISEKEYEKGYDDFIDFLEELLKSKIENEE